MVLGKLGFSTRKRRTWRRQKLKRGAVVGEV